MQSRANMMHSNATQYNPMQSNATCCRLAESGAINGNLVHPVGSGTKLVQPGTTLMQFGAKCVQTH